MNILAIETATDACSVALSMDGACIERFAIAPRRHTELLLPMAEELLAEAGLTRSALDAIAFGAGPGAFTGLRIAAAFTQGIALPHDLPVAPVSSLAALALAVAERAHAAHMLAAFDARMGEVYWGGYRYDADTLIENVIDECVSHPSAVPLPDGGHWHACGSGWAAYRDTLTARAGSLLATTHEDYHPHATAVARLGALRLHMGLGVDADQALPVYLRDKVTN